MRTGARDYTFGFLRPLFGHPLENGLQDRIRIDSLGFTLEIQNHAMTKRRQNDVTDIFESDFRSAVEQSADLPADRQRLRATRARAVSKEFLGLLVSQRRAGLSRHDDTDRVVLDSFRDRHA